MANTGPIEEFMERAEALSKAMENSDLFLRSRMSIERTNNWMIAVVAGTLLWIMSNFDKFYIDRNENEKVFMIYPFIFIALLFLFSLIFLIINKYRMGNSEYLMNKAKDRPKILAVNVLDLLKTEHIEEHEIRDLVEKEAYEIIQDWIRGHNLIDICEPLLKVGIALYIIGSSLFIAYFINFLLHTN